MGLRNQQKLLKISGFSSFWSRYVNEFLLLFGWVFENEIPNLKVRIQILKSENEIPQENLEAATEATLDILPEGSKSRYEEQLWIGVEKKT